MNIVFAGTPDFAGVALARLHAAGCRLSLVMTQPDRPAGRGMKLAASPVKAFATRHAVPVVQPRSLRLDGPAADEAAQARASLQAAAPDVIVVAAYGLILPAWVLELPRYGCINIHASLLPRWRGAAPIQRAIEAGDARTGITIMQMDAGLDTGDMLLAEGVDIGPDDTAASLHDRLAPLGGRLIVEALELAACGGLVHRPQPASGATYARKIDKSEAPIDWRRPAAELERRIRAFDPFPGCSFELGAQSLKCWRADVVDGQGPPGEVLRLDDCAPVIACGTQALRLTQLQRPGGRRLPAALCLHGGPLRAGDMLAAAGD